MDEFGALVLGALAAGLLLLYALGRLYPGSRAEQVGWRAARSPELEAELEARDLEEMLEAQNARRRASGRREIGERDVRARLAEDERWRAERLARSRGAAEPRPRPPGA